MKKKYNKKNLLLYAFGGSILTLGFQNCTSSERSQGSLTKSVTAKAAAVIGMPNFLNLEKINSDSPEYDRTIFQREIDQTLLNLTTGKSSPVSIRGSVQLSQKGILTVKANYFNGDSIVTTGVQKSFEITFWAKGRISTSRFIPTDRQPVTGTTQDYYWQEVIDADADCLVSSNLSTKLPRDGSELNANKSSGGVLIILSCTPSSDTTRIDLSKAFEQIVEDGYTFNYFDGSDILRAGEHVLDSNVSLKAGVYEWPK